MEFSSLATRVLNVYYWLTTSLKTSLSRFLLLIFIFGLVACGGGSDRVEPDPGPPPVLDITVSGQVQKGLFTDLSVEVFPVDQNGQLGESFNAQTEGSSYSFTIAPGQMVNVRASGTFIDETTGNQKVVSTEQPLESVFESNTDPHNINILTTMVTSHWRGNMASSSQSITQQLNESNNAIKQNLGFDTNDNFETLDITAIESIDDPSFSLLMLSGAILNLGVDLSQPPSTNIPSTFSTTLNAIEMGLPLTDALDIFNGINVVEVFEQIQQSGTIETLPELTIDTGSFFICAPFCNIVIELNPTVVVNNLVVYEGQKSGLIHVTRTGTDLSELSLSVNFTDDTAIRNQDYASIQQSVTFAAGQTSRYIEVYPIIDNEAEGQESLTVNFSLPANSEYSLSKSTSLVTILDGIPTSAQLPNQLDISTTGCFVNVGLPETLLQNTQIANQLVCANTSGAGQATDSQTDLSLQVLTGVQADCSAANCTSSTFWPFEVSIEAINPVDGSFVSSIVLGELLYPSASVIASINDTLTEPRLINMSASQVTTFLNDALANAYDVNLRLGAANNGNASVTPTPVALPIIAPLGDIIFGNSELALADGATISVDGNCPNPNDVKINGTFSYSVLFAGQNNLVDYTGEVCASFVVAQKDQLG